VDVSFHGRRAVKLGGEPALQLRLEYPAAEDVPPISVTQVFAAREPKVVALVLSSPSDVHSEFAALMDSLVASAEFR
jgi:hypothetical protein